MQDFLEDYGGVICCVALLLFSFVGCSYDIYNDHRLIQQCLDDGQPEYFCRTIVRGG